METIKDLEDLFIHYIQNLYSSEEQLLEVMPAIIEKVNHRSLKNALQHHLDVSKEHKARLEKIPAILSEKKKRGAGETKGEKNFSLQPGQKCKGMTGLVEEASELLSLDIDTDVTDAVISGCVQKIEHYEVCTYGTALAYANQLHLYKAEQLLRETLDEEYDADDLLTALATAALNKEAVPEGTEEQDDQDLEVNEETGNAGDDTSRELPKVIISERTVNSPGGRAGTSHRRYPSGESRGH
ncbi:MAG TPA: DUF892 family protein [Segetibacter sp.]